MRRHPLHLFGALLVALLLAACMPAEPATPAEPAEPANPSETVDGTVPGGNDEVREEILGEPSGDVDTGRAILQGSLSSDARDLIERGLSRDETGYSYFYTKLDGTRLAADASNQATIHQKGSTRNIVLYDEIQFSPDFFAEGVILDSEARTATAYCELRKCNWSPGQEPVTRERSYEDFDFITPSDWLERFENLKETGSETISGRLTLKFTGDVDGSSAVLWIDRYSGLPMQVQTGESTYQYTKFVLGVKDEELAP